MEEAINLSVDEDDERTPIEPAKLNTSTVVDSHGTRGCARAPILLLLLLPQLPPRLTSQLRRLSLRRKGGRCLDCRSNLVRRLGCCWFLSARPTQLYERKPHHIRAYIFASYPLLGSIENEKKKKRVLWDVGVRNDCQAGDQAGDSCKKYSAYWSHRHQSGFG